MTGKQCGLCLDPFRPWSQLALVWLTRHEGDARQPQFSYRLGVWINSTMVSWVFGGANSLAISLAEGKMLMMLLCWGGLRIVVPRCRFPTARVCPPIHWFPPVLILSSSPYHTGSKCVSPKEAVWALTEHAPLCRLLALTAWSGGKEG